MNDKEKLKAALKAVAKPDGLTTVDVHEAMLNVTKIVEDMCDKLIIRSKDVEKDLTRGAQLTRHRISL